MSAEPTIAELNSTTSAYVQLPGGWFLNNAGWITGSSRTLLVDTCANEARSRHLLDTARAANPDAPITAVLTHAHGDHVNGAGLVARAGGTVLASASAASEVLSGPHTYPELFDCSTWGDITPPASTDTVTQATSINLGDVTADILPVPTQAHTSGDLVVWQSHDRVLFTGDLVFKGVTPLGLHGCFTGWLDALNWIETFGAERLVPGHGPVVTAEDRTVADMRDYIHWLLDAVADTPSPDFARLEAHAHHRWRSWRDAERHAANLRIARVEMHGHDSPLADAVGAMLQTTGGPIQLDL